MSTPEADLPSLERSTAIYRHVMYHRSLILEPIKQIAFRNMRHLSSAMANHPKPKRADIHSSGEQAWIERIQDQMLKDQGVEPSTLDRLLIHKATLTPVKLYEALLYAEIEFLDKWKNEFGLSGHNDLHEFLQAEDEFIERSKDFRHGILHPNEQSI